MLCEISTGFLAEMKLLVLLLLVDIGFTLSIVEGDQYNLLLFMFILWTGINYIIYFPISLLLSVSSECLNVDCLDPVCEDNEISNTSW